MRGKVYDEEQAEVLDKSPVRRKGYIICNFAYIFHFSMFVTRYANFSKILYNIKTVVKVIELYHDLFKISSFITCYIITICNLSILLEIET